MSWARLASPPPARTRHRGLGVEGRLTVGLEGNGDGRGPGVAGPLGPSLAGGRATLSPSVLTLRRDSNGGPAAGVERRTPRGATSNQPPRSEARSMRHADTRSSIINVYDEGWR